MSTWRATGVWTALLILVAFFPSAGSAAAQDAPRRGGILKAAMTGELPTLDTHTTTATIAYQIAWHVFETLYMYDRQYAPVPHLAEGHTITEGGRRYTVTLRKGVQFHNGKDLTAAASVMRWGRLHPTGKTISASARRSSGARIYVVVLEGGKR